MIILGFLLLILLGSALLMLPVSRRQAIGYVDALFTATSAACVTGLIAVDTGDAFTVFGRVVIAALMQIGGLGVAGIGVAVILLMRRRVGMKGRMIVKEGWNLASPRGVVRLIRAVLGITLAVELIGMAFSYPVFARDHAPLAALGISAFHVIASFNNAGFDILGGFQSLAPYRDSALLLITTALMIVLGGLGFLVLLDVFSGHPPRRWSLHTKIVLLVSCALLAVGTALLWLLEDIGPLGAFFTSASARTAGFASHPLNGFTAAGRFAIVLLMFIGASPGSTGGGIKTTTFFALGLGVWSIVANRYPGAFHRTVPRDTLYKAFVVTTLALALCALALLALLMLEPNLGLDALAFEVVSAFATVGLTTGITPQLSMPSKLLLAMMMFIGRLGPLTVASLLTFRELPGAHYSKEPIPIG